jgi:hypothetical protein
MKFGLFGSRKDVERTEKRIMENGGLRLRTKIAKDITGDQSAIREFDVAEGSVADWQDRQPLPSEPVRLGDSYLPPSNKVGFLPFTMRTWDTATGNPRPDMFLRGDARDGYIGGVEKPYRAGLEFQRDEAGAYRFVQPDADAREDENFADAGDSGIAGPAAAQFPDAGQIGGREPGSYTVKALKAMLADETDDRKRKALKAAINAMKASMGDDDDSDDENYDDRKRKFKSGAGTIGGFETQAQPVAKRLGLFKSAIFSRQTNDRNGSAGTRAADDFLSGGR